jgi:hypothetical protein
MFIQCLPYSGIGCSNHSCDLAVGELVLMSKLVHEG